jgi:hypothetical protein
MKISRATIHHFNKEELNIPTNIEENKKKFSSFYHIWIFYMHKKEIK